MAKASTKKRKVEDDLEELDEDLELELEELDEDEPAPKARKGKAKARKTKAAASDEVTFGSTELAALIEEETGEAMTARALRLLLRRMARNGDLDRDNDSKVRYSWSGPKDPEVRAILKAVKAGELKAERSERMESLKKKKPAAKKKTRSKRS